MLKNYCSSDLSGCHWVVQCQLQIGVVFRCPLLLRIGQWVYQHAKNILSLPPSLYLHSPFYQKHLPHLCRITFTEWNPLLLHNSQHWHQHSSGTLLSVTLVHQIKWPPIQGWCLELKPLLMTEFLHQTHKHERNFSSGISKMAKLALQLPDLIKHVRAVSSSYFIVNRGEGIFVDMWHNAKKNKLFP